MKKIIFLFSLLFMPIMCCGLDDACTKPKEYTVDKRCYVTDTQKKQKPYNAVVRVFLGCTGTIVKGKNGKPYLYTAKHCTNDGDGLARSTLRIKLQNDTELDVYKNNVGNYNIIEDSNFNGDWAVYSIKKTDVPMVEKSSKPKIGLGRYDIPYDARVVGYGTLKIMSDKEIKDFKREYVKYLFEQEYTKSLKDERDIKFDIESAENGFYKGGINIENKKVLNFITSYTYKIMNDNRQLKVSFCKYTSTGRHLGCQFWGGNSGGPIFDEDGKIMGIHTRGNRMIGGENHAGKENWWNSSTHDSVRIIK